MDCFFILLGKIALAVWAIQLSWWMSKKMFSWIWPSKKVWERTSSEDEIPIQGDKVDRWRTSGNQKKGDMFMLKIVPPRTYFAIRLALWVGHITSNERINKIFMRLGEIRQERVIDRIQFMHEPYLPIAYPIKYAVTISGVRVRDIYNDWREREFSSGDSNIHIEFPHPIKIHRFSIKIVEPADTYWGFGRIDIREVRLPFWRTNIK